MHPIRKLLLAAAIALTHGTAGAQPADDYPNRAVTIIVPFGVGGSADIYTRQIAEKLREKFGQPFVIVNKTGSGGVVGTALAAHANPDGYTLLTTGNAQLINEPLRKDKPYEFLRDFVPVAPINEANLVLVAHPRSGAKTVQELVQRARANPAKLNYASAGVGTPYHLAAELFKSISGIDVVHVPYRGSNDARTAVLAGEVEYMFDSVATMTGPIRNGRVLGLASTGQRRSALLPDIPTMQEAGIKGYTASILVGLVAPAGTPKAITGKLNRAINAIIDTPELKASWAKQGVEPMLMNTEEFGRYLKDEIARYRKIVEDARIPSI